MLFNVGWSPEIVDHGGKHLLAPVTMPIFLLLVSSSFCVSDREINGVVKGFIMSCPLAY